MPPAEKPPERQEVPLHLRQAISLAEQAATGDCKVLPGTKWGLHYPEDGAKRERAIQALLNGTAPSKEIIADLRPDAMMFNASDIDTLGLPAVTARIREATASVQYYNFERFADFIVSMRGKDVDPEALEQLYDGIAGSRTRNVLLEGFGEAGQRQMKEALCLDARRSGATMERLYGIRRIAEALKLRWLQAKGLADPQAMMGLEHLRPLEQALVEALAGNFERYVNSGDPGSYKALVEEIERQLPALERVSEQQSESMEELAEELEEFMQEPEQRPAVDGLALPPDEKDESIIPPEQPYESGDAGSTPAMFEITPSGSSTRPLVGYYNTGKMSHYDVNTKIWSKKKILKPYTATVQGTERQTIRGAADTGLKELCLPTGYALDMSSLRCNGPTPEFFRDQNGCFYYKSTGKGTFSIDYLKDPQPQQQVVLPEDTQPLHVGALSAKTETLLNHLHGSNVQKAEQVRQYVKGTHFYPGGGDPATAAALQAKLIHQSTGANYLQNLDASEYLECRSSNTLFVALCRKVGVPARLVEGHFIDQAKDGKARVDASTGHAWAEIWDGAAWRRIDATPPPKPEDQKKKKDKKGDQGTPTLTEEADDGGIDDTQEGGDLGDQVGSRIDEQVQSVQEGSQGRVSDADVQNAQQRVADAKEKMKKMRDRLKEFQDRIQGDKNFKDLEKIREDGEKADLLDEDHQELNDNIEAKKKQKREQMRDKLDAMQKDGFIDEQKKEQLESFIDKEDARELDRLWEVIEQQDALHAEFESLRAEVAPLVERWYQHFHETLPRRNDLEIDEDREARGGAIDRHALRSPRKLMLHTVRNPRVIRSTTEPRFLAKFMVDVSGSMEGPKLKNAQKLFIFYCELFSRISQEFGYIRYSADIFSDGVTPIKAFAHDYQSPERYAYPDGASTTKARIMTHMQSAGGTNMLTAVKSAAADLHAEMRDFPDYAASFFFVGDGGDTCGNAANIREFLAMSDAEGMGNIMRSATLLGEESDREQLAEIFGDENTTVASTFETLVAKNMNMFTQQAGDYMRRFESIA